jgi:hypothetical protein
LGLIGLSHMDRVPHNHRSAEEESACLKPKASNLVVTPHITYPFGQVALTILFKLFSRCCEKASLMFAQVQLLL